jgi:hypothetical protein
MHPSPPGSESRRDSAWTMPPTPPDQSPPDNNAFAGGKHDLDATDWTQRRNWSGDRPFVTDPRRQKSTDSTPPLAPLLASRGGQVNNDWR